MIWPRSGRICYSQICTRPCRFTLTALASQADSSQFMMPQTTVVRIDKWLWAARFFKTRTQAADAVENGKVRVAGERVKPARNLKAGEVLQVDNGSTAWEVTVLALADARGSAAQAQLLYQETVDSIALRARMADERRFYREPGTTLKNRPTKRDRRQIDKSTG